MTVSWELIDAFNTCVYVHTYTFAHSHIHSCVFSYSFISYVFLMYKICIHVVCICQATKNMGTKLPTLVCESVSVPKLKLADGSSARLLPSVTIVACQDGP